MARKLSIARTAGFVQGAFMTPLEKGDNNWTRLGHGAATSLTFMTAEALPYAPGLKTMNKGFTAGLIKSAVIGGAAGAEQIQLNTLFTTGHPARAMPKFIRPWVEPQEAQPSMESPGLVLTPSKWRG